MRGEIRSALYIGCVYMTIYGIVRATTDDSYNLVEEMSLLLNRKGRCFS